MFGRKDYTKQELANGQAAVDEALAAYRTLVKALGKPDKRVGAALDAFETVFFNNMTIVLDRYFVHRLRMVTGKDGNPINEVELLADSLMNHDGTFEVGKVVKFVPDQSVLGQRPGQRIAITEQDFERLAAAFLADLQAKFV